MVQCPQGCEELLSLRAWIKRFICIFILLIKNKISYRQTSKDMWFVFKTSCTPLPSVFGMPSWNQSFSNPTPIKEIMNQRRSKTNFVLELPLEMGVWGVAPNLAAMGRSCSSKAWMVVSKCSCRDLSIMYVWYN